MKLMSKKYGGYTVIELLSVTVIIWLVMPCIIAVYSFMLKSNREFALRQTTIQQWYEFFEKLNILMQDYTIDYEEYYNRQMVGCVWNSKRWNNFKWNIWTSWYCTNFTAYWNENSTEKKTGPSLKISNKYHDIYYCSSEYDKNWGLPYRIVRWECWNLWEKQSFGQYAALFTDVRNPYQNDDDKDLWEPLSNWKNAILDANNVQELYLISHDWKSRLYLRRKLVAQTWDFAQYRIQLLRLRWFDAGQKHSFDNTSEWSYDGQIDTRACDTSMWFEPTNKSPSNSVWWAYSWYYLPQNEDDCWVDLSYWSTTISTRNIVISPLNDSDLYRNDQSKQINPYMKMLVVNGIYSPATFSGSSITEFKIPIETTINMKDFYKE